MTEENTKFMWSKIINAIISAVSTIVAVLLGTNIGG